MEGRKYKYRLLVLISALAIPGLNLFAMGRALTQIVPDTTLGTERSIVTPKAGGVDLLSGGAKRGANLFHSFAQFSVRTGRTAYFNNAANIQNIISRVTGGSVSSIDGLIKANGTANLFLINPSGIVFGRNAALNVGGSFVASTASGLKFADGTQFSATASQTSPLLTVSVPIGLQFEGNPGGILNQSQANAPSGNFVGLRVLAGRTLALVGGNVSLDGGNLQTPGSRVELAGVAGAGTVGLNVDGNNLSLSLPDSIARADISLAHGAYVDTSSDGGGGDVEVQGRRVTLTDASEIVTDAVGAGQGGALRVVASDAVELSGTTPYGMPSGLFTRVNRGAKGAGGNLLITTGRLSLSNGAQVAASTSGAGNAGSLTVNASNVELSGTSPDGAPSVLSTNVNRAAKGGGGNLTINTGRLSLSDGAQVSASTSGVGNAGSLTVNASDVELSGAPDLQYPSGLFTQVSRGAEGVGGSLTINTGRLSISNGAAVSASTSGAGKAGSLTVNASNVELSGSVIGPDGQHSSVLFASVQPGAEGAGGNLTINTGRLSISNGAQVGVGTFGAGKAGSLTVNASDVELSGTTPDGEFSSGLFASVEPGAEGAGGNLTINTGRLSISNGAQVSAGTSGATNAGSLTVNALDVELSGTTPDGEFSSGLFADVQPGAEGAGGNLTINTGRLSISNGAQVGAGTFGAGKAGSLTVNASDIELTGIAPNGKFSSGLFTNVDSGAQGAGGNLTINTGRLSISNGAQVGAGTSGSGKGGSIQLQASDSVELSNGGIITTATRNTGQAGDISVYIGNQLSIDGADSGVFANTTPGSTGNGGNIFIDPINLTLSNGASIAVNSRGLGNAGDLQIQAGTLTLDRASLSATTASTEGGNISLQTQNLLLRRGSVISTTAGTANAGGNGGRITITSPFVIAVPQENSKISANAFSGNGGSVTINASGIFGFQQPDANQSQITASSTGGGINGVVTLNTPEIDPSRGLVALPVIFADASRQIATGCGSGSTTTGQFIVTGRGGLPPNPNDTISSDALLDDMRLPTTTVGKKHSATVATTPPSDSDTVPIVPATGVAFNGNDEVTLIAATPAATLQIPWLSPTACHAYAP